MLFSTGNFIFLFLPVSLLGFQLLSRFGRTATLSWLAVISMFFYGYWNPRYLILLMASIGINYLLSLRIGCRTLKEASRSSWLVTAITANLLLLAWFKYLFPVLSFLHFHGVLPRSFGEVLLPLGISFFTFTQIAYLIDLRQDVAKQNDLLSYVVFVTFFPHLIAGPIIHPREIMPQLEQGRLGRLRLSDVSLGLSWFILGLGKKVLLADVLAPSADALYAHPADFGFAATWLAAICYAMQLYFDFSGYSDMALGLARMFSIEFPFNFNSPYKAPSIIDFWQRWHMTLSRYLGEYLYTPILRSVNSRRVDAGKKVSRKAQATLGGFMQMVLFPIMTTMFLAGIWHGAGLQYLIFGLLHGIFLVINHAWRIFTPKGHPLHGKLPTPVSVILNFVCVLASLVFFRSSNVSEAIYVLKTMVGAHGLHGTSMGQLRSISLEVALSFLIVWAMPNTQEILGQLKPDEVRLPSILQGLTWRPSAVWSVTLMILFCASILMLDTSTSFLYFQF